jgi:hypothetical protein
MVIQNLTVQVYDIEIFPNVFHCTCKNTETGELSFFEISNRRNQLKELVDFFRINTQMFCGYNNKRYDDVIINYCIDLYDKLRWHNYIKICQSLFNLSKCIIESEQGNSEKFKKWMYCNYFYSMDLLTMQFSSKLRVGLKEMQVTMHYKNVQEYSGNFDDWLKDSEIDKMIEYNINDVESTTELLNRLKKDIDLRLFIQEEYNIDALSMDSVKFGETLLLQRYCESTQIDKKIVKEMRSPADYINLKDVILPFIEYKNPILQNVLEEMKKQTVYTKERKGYEKKFYINDVCYSVGVGGIHSINKPKIFIPKEDEYIGHSDVASMYPSFIIQYKWIPRHLGDAFYNIYKQIYDERIEAKHTGQDLKNKALKLTLNSVTGKMQQETSWMYDPFNVFKIRINGQLCLLMLVDKLLSLNCKIIQVNTDGVMYVAKKRDEKTINKLISEVENITRLTFETDKYEAFYQYAVNDYIGVEAGYSDTKNNKLIEKKGMFITENKLGKGLAPVVIPKAVINYFLTKQPVSEFIKNDKNICDFLMTQRVDRKFKVVHGEKPVQRINRYYASTNDYYLYKISPEGQVNNILTKSGVTILNKFDNVQIQERHINYQYYISEARKIINDFEIQQLNLFSNQTC